jgi:hypothetical protein
VITLSGMATTRFFVSTSQPMKPCCMTGVERGHSGVFVSAGPGRTPARAGLRSGPVPCRCGTVSRSSLSHNRGERKERVDVERLPHLPQSRTELEEFFDLSIDVLCIVGLTATSSA